MSLFDWYEKNTSDILMKLAMPGIFLGSLDAPYQNAGKVRNRGWELAANYFDQKGDWAWQAGFSLSGVKNEITDMKGVEDISNNTINREGEAIGSYYGLETDGLYTQEEIDAGHYYKYGRKPNAGDIKYVPQRENVEWGDDITDDDRTIIGKDVPDFTYGININLQWKNFELSAFWPRRFRYQCGF